MSAVALLLPLLATAVAGPECTSGGDPIQSLICRDATLRAREAEVQRLYKSAEHTLPPPQRTAQRTRQNAWLGERAACAPDPDARNCVADAQGRRIVELKLALGELPVSASATYLCKGHESTPLHGRLLPQRPTGRAPALPEPAGHRLCRALRQWRALQRRRGGDLGAPGRGALHLAG